MKTVNVKIDGQEYPLCLSTRVMVALEGRARAGGRDLSGELQAIMADGSVSGAFWLLAQMLKAGRRAAQMEDGPEPLEPPDYDELIDLVAVGEYAEIFRALREAVEAGMATTVQAEAPKGKSAKPTRGN